MTTLIKDPNAVLDYKFDWKAKTNLNGNTDWLMSAETISSIGVTVDSGLTVESSSITDTSTSATIWLSGGTEGVTYELTCKVTTSMSRIDERTINIKVEHR